MEYNTSLSKLIIPEYGRNVQKMVHSIIAIEDREKRNHQAKSIIEVMGNLNPHLRDVPDFKHKLWDHLFIMSDFHLDVDSPYDRPSKESFEEKPEMLKYSDNNIKFRHYGKILPLIIKRTIDLDEGEYKDFLVFTIANHMKKSYLTWNKANVEDEVILKHLSQMSDDKLSMKETFKLSSFSDVKTQKNYKKNYSRGRNHGKRK
ncbi:MAG: DUF4290 domain-containing protein [Flavobacteriales bacterium]|jgi:hypothetical protein|nr:MAG: hypothetical protein CND86_02805 [Bacteroidetes bacterium MED-G21]|tara:strand:- start:3361 stop:3969 length:609 start_codon:yes stop_codon:yes gene_type:complete